MAVGGAHAGCALFTLPALPHAWPCPLLTTNPNPNLSPNPNPNPHEARLTEESRKRTSALRAEQRLLNEERERRGGSALAELSAQAC